MSLEDSIDQNELDEKNELLIVRNIRLKINKQLMADGKVPDDPEKLDFLMQNLRDIDKSALTRTKIKSDEKTSSATNETISMVTNVLQSLRGGKALPPQDITDIPNPSCLAPVLPAQFERTEFIPGETKIGVISEDIDSFMERMNKDKE